MQQALCEANKARRLDFWDDFKMFLEENLPELQSI
jgi:hypothetical protein